MEKNIKKILLICVPVFFIIMLFILVGCFIFAGKNKDIKNESTVEIESANEVKEQTGEQVNKQDKNDVDNKSYKKSYTFTDKQKFLEWSMNTINYSAINPSKNISVSNDFKDFEIGIDGNKYHMPFSADDLFDLNGFEIQENESETLTSGQWEQVSLYKDGEVVALATIVNRGFESTNYKETEICALTQACWDKAMEPENVIIFPGGIHIGKRISHEELIALFGEPDDIYDPKEYSMELAERYGEELDEGTAESDIQEYVWYDTDNETYPDSIRVYTDHDVITEIRMRNLFDLENPPKNQINENAAEENVQEN